MIYIRANGRLIGCRRDILDAIVDGLVRYVTHGGDVHLETREGRRLCTMGPPVGYDHVRDVQAGAPPGTSAWSASMQGAVS